MGKSYFNLTESTVNNKLITLVSLCSSLFTSALTLPLWTIKTRLILYLDSARAKGAKRKSGGSLFIETCS